MKFRYLALIGTGVTLFCFAAMVASSAIEGALGRDAGSLAWGPALFRALLALHGLLLILIGSYRITRPGAGQNPSPVTSPASQETRRYWMALVAVMALALGLRLWRINSCLWLDEVLTLLDFVRPPLTVIVTSFPNQNQHMLYSILAHASLRVFGESAAALRLPSLLFGVGSIWALFLLGRRLIGAQQALLACALMTVSYHHVWFSQNARGYTGLLFFATLATWLWLEALSRGQWRWWIGYALALFFGLAIHMTMVFVLASHGLLYILFLMLPLHGKAGVQSVERKAGAKPVLAWLLCSTLTLQFYALVLPEFFREALHEVSLRSEWTNPLWALTEIVHGLQIGWSGAAVVLLGAALVVIGFASLLLRERRAALAMILPALLGGFSILSLRHNLWPRFFFFAMGFGLLVVVHGAMTVPALAFIPIRAAALRKSLTAHAGLLLTGLMIVASALTLPRCYALPKQDFSGARDWVEHNRKPDDVAVSVGLAAIAYSRYFAPHWNIAGTRTELDRIRSRHATVWLVYTLPVQLKAFNPRIWRAIESDFELVKVFPGTLGGGEIDICKERPGASANLSPTPPGLTADPVWEAEKTGP